MSLVTPNAAKFYAAVSQATAQSTSAGHISNDEEARLFADAVLAAFQAAANIAWSPLDFLMKFVAEGVPCFDSAELVAVAAFYEAISSEAIARLEDGRIESEDQAMIFISRAFGAFKVAAAKAGGELAQFAPKFAAESGLERDHDAVLAAAAFYAAIGSVALRGLESGDLCSAEAASVFAADICQAFEAAAEQAEDVSDFLTQFAAVGLFGFNHEGVAAAVAFYESISVTVMQGMESGALTSQGEATQFANAAIDAFKTAWTEADGTDDFVEKFELHICAAQVCL